MTKVELIYFTRCPHVDAARSNVRAALEATGRETHWTEWDQHDPAAPEAVQGFASPTVLVDGRDVTGLGRGPAAGCRTEGAPSVSEIVAALGGNG